MVVTLQANPICLVDGVEALKLSCIKPNQEIAVFIDETWCVFKVRTIPFLLKLKSTDSWWATMTNLTEDSSNDTLPRNLANLGIVQDMNGAWMTGRVAVHVADLPKIERADWPHAPFLF